MGGGFDFAGLLLWYLAFLFSITLHEAAHAWVAYRGGDPTAYRAGQVTLDPLPHIRREPVGTVLCPLISYLTNGWMVGWASAPYDPGWARRHPRLAALMAAAGPAANLAVVMVVFLVLKALLVAEVLAVPGRVSFTQVVAPAGQGAPPWAAGACQLASILLNLNLIFVAFNLLPLPPLDGHGMLSGLLSRASGGIFRALEENPMFSLLGLLVAWSVFGKIFRPLFILVLRLLYAGIP